MNELKLDANESAYLEQELEMVLEKVLKREYEALKARSFIPVNPQRDPGAETIVYHELDVVGIAKLITSKSKDIPRIDVYGKKFVSTIETLGDAYGWDVFEIKKAIKAGVPLNDRKAMAAREAMERAVDQIAAFGDSSTGLTGFLNNANVTVAAPTTGGWTSATDADLILADINEMYDAIPAATADRESPDTLLLPTAKYNLIAGMTRSATSDTSVLEMALKNQRAKNPAFQIASWNLLGTAGAAGATRAVCYSRNSDKLELQIPMEFETLPPQADGTEQVVNCLMRIGGVTVYKPLSMLYTDGI